MKAKFEIGGYEIEIEEVDGTITVKAEKDEEVVEEFTLNAEESFDNDDDDDDFESEDQDGEKIKSFDDFGEEDDFKSDDNDSEEDDDYDNDEDNDEGIETSEEKPKVVDKSSKFPEEKALESFQSFINKRRK